MSNSAGSIFAVIFGCIFIFIMWSLIQNVLAETSSRMTQLSEELIVQLEEEQEAQEVHQRNIKPDEVNNTEEVVDNTEDEITVEEVLNDEPVETVETIGVSDTSEKSAFDINSIGATAGTITIVGFCLFMIVILLASIKEGLFGKSKKQLMKEKAKAEVEEKQKEEIRQIVKEQSEFEKYQEEFQNNLTLIKGYSLGITDEEIKKCIRQTISTINELYDNIDETEFNRGNLANVNSKYLKYYGNIISSYNELSGVLNSKAVTMNYKDRTNRRTLVKTVKELRDTIINFNTIFADLLVEAVDKDAFNASIEASFINNYATQNGLGNSSMLLKNVK